jgi:hypothetical protein
MTVTRRQFIAAGIASISALAVAPLLVGSGRSREHQPISSLPDAGQDYWTCWISQLTRLTVENLGPLIMDPENYGWRNPDLFDYIAYELRGRSEKFKAANDWREYLLHQRGFNEVETFENPDLSGFYVQWRHALAPGNYIVRMPWGWTSGRGFIGRSA